MICAMNQTKNFKFQAEDFQLGRPSALARSARAGASP
jgi:hypothetical protein